MFITTIEMIKHCECAFHLRIRETTANVVHMTTTTSDISWLEFLQNVENAIAYLKPFAKEKGYKVGAYIPERSGEGYTATVQFKGIRTCWLISVIKKMKGSACCWCLFFFYQIFYLFYIKLSIFIMLNFFGENFVVPFIDRKYKTTESLAFIFSIAKKDGRV